MIKARLWVIQCKDVQCLGTLSSYIMHFYSASGAIDNNILREPANPADNEAPFVSTVMDDTDYHSTICLNQFKQK